MRSSGLDVVVGAALALTAWLLPHVATRAAPSVLLEFGPNDADYLAGFRSDWERDGHTRFHWTSDRSRVTLPIRVSGRNLKLYLRWRRHFAEPAQVRLQMEGRTVTAFESGDDARYAYQVLEVPLPHLAGRRPFTLEIEAPSANSRPLGLALDRMELRREGPGAAISLEGATRGRIVGLVLLAFVAPRVLGLARLGALLHSVLLIGFVSAGALLDPLAVERVVREGTAAYAFTACLAVLLGASPAARRFLLLERRRDAAVIVLVVLVALSIRLALLLHPRFYYPDVRVHARFAWQLARDGLATFLSEFTANQYRHSLGLQFESGHWYAFPYPPAFYVLCWPLVALARYRAEVAVSIVAAVVNSLEAFLVYGIARRLLRSVVPALVAAALTPLLPIFVARLGLAYFPALVGHAADTLVILYLLARIDSLGRPRVVAALGALLAAALLTYTQSVLNFGILLPLYLALDFTGDRGAAARRRLVGVAAAGALGVVLALVAFYGRYVPVFLDMRRGVPMAEERILLEKMERERGTDAAVEAPDDPYAGPGVDLGRGLRKAGSRLLVFYGGFAPLLLAGVVLVTRRAPGPEARWVAAWASTYVILNLASGGLPGPNLVRYNKDMEIVAPLCCAALAAVGTWLWSRRGAGRWIAAGLALVFVAFGVTRAARALTGTFEASLSSPRPSVTR